MGKKRKHKKAQGINSLIAFSLTFALVLCAGMTYLGVLSYQKSHEKEKKLVYEVFRVPVHEEEKFENTPLQEEIDKNQEIYQAALEKGQRVKMLPCVDENKVKLLFAGDVLLDEGYAIMSNFKMRGSDLEDTFGNGLLYEMQMADLFMINNEFPYTLRGTPTEGKQFTFHANPQNVSVLLDMGVDMVNIANNHIYDYGEVSLLDTLDTLEGADMPYVGAGRNLEAAKEPYYIVANGMKIAFVAGTQIEKYAHAETKGATESTPGTLRCVNPEDLLQSIKVAEENADLTILYIHWGTESMEQIDEMQKKQVDLYVDAGVDLIIGAHPHVLQKMEYVKNVPVVYSLGNFWFHSKERDTGMAEVVIENKEIASVCFVPCKQIDSKTMLLDGDEKARVIQEMNRLSGAQNLDEVGKLKK